MYNIRIRRPPTEASGRACVDSLLLQMARGLSAGYEQYIFKFSSTPSANGGIAKARGRPLD